MRDEGSLQRGGIRRLHAARGGLLPPVEPGHERRELGPRHRLGAWSGVRAEEMRPARRSLLCPCLRLRRPRRLGPCLLLRRPCRLRFPVVRGRGRGRGERLLDPRPHRLGRRVSPPAHGRGGAPPLGHDQRRDHEDAQRHPRGDLRPRREPAPGARHREPPAREGDREQGEHRREHAQGRREGRAEALIERRQVQARGEEGEGQDQPAREGDSGEPRPEGPHPALPTEASQGGEDEVRQRHAPQQERRPGRRRPGQLDGGDGEHHPVQRADDGEAVAPWAEISCAAVPW